MSVTGAVPTFTPGLTHGQRQQVADALHRVGGVPVGMLALVFMDVDRAAAQVFSTRYAVRAALRGERDATPRADDIVPAVAHEHGVSLSPAAFAFGLAVGLRMARRFWPERTRNLRRHVSDDWARLDKNQRERTKRFMQMLAAGLEPRFASGPALGSRRKATTIAADLAAAKRLLREAGQRVRAEARR